MQEFVAQTWRQGLPVEATFEQLIQFRVRREHLLSDFCGQVWWRPNHVVPISVGSVEHGLRASFGPTIDQRHVSAFSLDRLRTFLSLIDPSTMRLFIR